MPKKEAHRLMRACLAPLERTAVLVEHQTSATARRLTIAPRAPPKSFPAQSGLLGNLCDAW